MIVENIMKTNVLTLNESSSIGEAFMLMQKNRIRHLPVIDAKKRVIGIVSDRDIREASPSILHPEDKYFHDFPITKIMSTNVITGSPLDFIEDVASCFYEYKISCLPITKNDVLIGIVTETDLLRIFIELTGAHQPGSRLEVRVDNYPGMLAEVSAVISQLKININSVIVYPDQDERYKVLVFHIQVMHPKTVVKTLIEKGYHVLWPTM